MAIIEITYDAKCKHCDHLVRTSKGKRVVHRCSRLGKDNLQDSDPVGWSVTLKTRACKDFKMFGS